MSRYTDIKNNVFTQYRETEIGVAIEFARKNDAKLFWKKYHSEFQFRYCPGCASQRFHLLEKYLDLYPIVRCSHCTLVYSQLIPSVTMLDEYYQNAESIVLLNQFYASRNKNNIVSSSRESQIVELIQKKSAAVRILEIGCGNGAFLEGLRNKFPEDALELYGVEPNRQEAAAARERDIQVYECYLGTKEGEEIAKRSYDLVLCFELIEHLLSPKDVFNTIYTILNSEGVLVITTPNIEGLGNILTGYNKYRLTTHAIAPPMHLNGFSRLSLAILAERAGFDVEFINAKSSFDAYEFVKYAEESCLIDKLPDIYKGIYQENSDIDVLCSSLQGLVNMLNAGAAITAVFRRSK
jgi:2-polyprenyl-3-methyl-5-hydroxy-6-metoxy-1,4-benzoquinol methylase